MEAQRTLLPEVSLPVAKPVLKWAGGKTQLLRTLRAAMPPGFNRYVEPFLGGGALFFDLAMPGALISDSNPDLIEFYEVVRDQPTELLEQLAHMPVTKEDYYRWRAATPDSLGKVVRAARFIYLNKTCYNGLHRVNKKGQFNTPFGGRVNVRVADSHNLFRASAVLRSAELRHCSYIEALRCVNEGDFVYLDPPYLPLGGYSDFRRYTKDFFGSRDHVELAEEFRRLHERGALLLLSNSDTPIIAELYEGFHQVRVNASRYINCQAGGRGQITELLISNYPHEIKCCKLS